jgi:hypothetical protein
MNCICFLLIPCLLAVSVNGQGILGLDLGLQDVTGLLLGNANQITNISLVKDLVKTLSLEPITNLGEAQIKNLLKVSSKNGLDEFNHYVKENPTGSISDFASRIGFEDFASTVGNFVVNEIAFESVYAKNQCKLSIFTLHSKNSAKNIPKRKLQ